MGNLTGTPISTPEVSQSNRLPQVWRLDDSLH
jgi:hypothetical protein